jgi:hypothetical protein
VRKTWTGIARVKKQTGLNSKRYNFIPQSIVTDYERYILPALREWQKKMQRKPSLTNRLAKGVQRRTNRLIPEKVHKVITTAFKHTIKAVLTGAEFISGKPFADADLEMRELRVQDRINIYRNTSAAEGAITGAGGILLGLADFPIWLTLKMKLLFDLAGLYGHDVSDYKERLYILYVFQLAFSSGEYRREVYAKLADWEHYSQTLPSFDEYDWRAFQQEYRDYIDLAKMLQLVPGIGALVGFYVNRKLTDKLGETAKNAYRMRWFNAAKKG